MDVTTIKISKKTKERLENLRSYRRESYEEIMEKILSVLNACRMNPEQARQKLLLIDKDRKRSMIDEEENSPEKDEEYQQSKLPERTKFSLRK
ncbi:hypothetical protein FJZ18_00955 [Candidatus Pacearchaeota archaeon]|nr:hypothetical protein [Candidatus Pacearchaeota archaeon]